MKFFINNNKKNYCVAKWIFSQPKYKLALVAFILLTLIGIGIFVFGRSYVAEFTHRYFASMFDEKMLCNVVLIILSVIPIILGYKIHSFAIRTLEAPFHSVANEHIVLSDDSLMYFYHYKYNPNPSSYECYSINYSEIKKIQYSEKYSIITIHGKGKFSVFYKDSSFLNYENQIESTSVNEYFSFFLCLDNIEMFFNQLSSNMKQQSI